MRLSWVSSNGTSFESVVNQRFLPTTASNVVGVLDAGGELAEYIKKESRPDGIWHNFKSIKTAKSYWCRSDVIKFHIFENKKKILPVPYVSQRDENSKLSNNDCGHASACMLLQYVGVDCTVDEYNKDVGFTRNFTNFAYHIKGLQQYGEDAKHVRPFHMVDYLDSIENNIPVFSLVDYGVLYENRNYGHFFVVIGYELSQDRLKIIVHDPYEKPRMEYSSSIFNDAISNRYNSDNYPFQALIPVYNSPTPSVSGVSKEDSLSKKTREDIMRQITIIESNIESITENLSRIKSYIADA